MFYSVGENVFPECVHVECIAWAGLLRVRVSFSMSDDLIGRDVSEIAERRDQPNSSVPQRHRGPVGVEVSHYTYTPGFAVQALTVRPTLCGHTADEDFDLTLDHLNAEVVANVGPIVGWANVPISDALPIKGAAVLSLAMVYYYEQGFHVTS